MYETWKGYRDDELFGEGYHDNHDVMMHEIAELGNNDSLYFWITQYWELFTEEERETLLLEAIIFIRKRR